MRSVSCIAEGVVTSLNRRKNSVVMFNVWYTHYLPKIMATRSQTSKP